jgi:hypothetical protein
MEKFRGIIVILKAFQSLRDERYTRHLVADSILQTHKQCLKLQRLKINLAETHTSMTA